MYFSEITIAINIIIHILPAVSTYKIYGGPYRSAVMQLKYKYA